MRGTAQISTPPRSRHAARSHGGLGMRRVGWVRVVLEADGRAICHLMGTGHRLPIVRRVPLATALSLAADGIPCVVRSGADEAAAVARSAG